MSYSIRITSIARQEEAEAYLFYEEKQQGLGDKFLNEVESTLNSVLQNPTFYGYCDTTKTIRDSTLDKFPFVIIFEVIETEVIVYNIHHTKKELK